MLKSCLVLSERLKNEYPAEIPAISLNALLQSAVSLNSKELLNPSYDLVNQLKEKIEWNPEIVAIDTMIKVMLGKYKEIQERKIEIVEEIKTLRDVELKFLEILSKYINKKVMDSVQISNDFPRLASANLIFGIIASASKNSSKDIETKLRVYPEINTENITDILMIYTVGNSIHTSRKNEWFFLDELFDEIKIREFSDKKNFEYPIKIKEILDNICNLLKRMIAEPHSHYFNFLKPEEIDKLLLSGDLKNIKKLKEICGEFEKLNKIAQNINE
ncbi:MAG: hypothetical protein ACRC6U_10285 [Fusobacteriaceae bacterium]